MQIDIPEEKCFDESPNESLRSMQSESERKGLELVRMFRVLSPQDQDNVLHLVRDLQSRTKP